MVVSVWLQILPILTKALIAEIMQSIPPDAKFFAKLDAVHGYFQLALDEPIEVLQGVGVGVMDLALSVGGVFRFRAVPGPEIVAFAWCVYANELVAKNSSSQI